MSRFARRLRQRSINVVATASTGPYGRSPIWHVAGGPEGRWPRFRDASSAAGSDLVFVDVGCTQAGSEFHLCATSEDGNIWHTIRHRDGSWQRFGDVSSAAQSPGPISAVDCAAIGRELHVCVVDRAGGLFHAIRHNNFSDRRRATSWSPFSNVKRMAEHDPGQFTDVGCVAIGDELHLCAITPPSGVWSAIRRGDGSWDQPFVDVREMAGDPGDPYRVDCATVSYGVSPAADMLAIVVLADRDGKGLRAQIAPRTRLHFDHWHPERWGSFDGYGLHQLDAVGAYYDVACTGLEEDFHVLVYDRKAKGIRHARGNMYLGKNWIFDVIDAAALGPIPGRVACSPAEPMTDLGARAFGELVTGTLSRLRSRLHRPGR
jgi:hypothetical protein